MVNFFWLVWIGLGAFVFFIYGWSLKVLIEQKRAWRAFAQKNKLSYEHGRLTTPASVTGLYEGYRIYLYTDAEFTPDIRGQRFVSVIELELGQGAPTGAAIGSKKLEGFVLSLERLRQEYKPLYEGWDDSIVLRTRNAAILKLYLTDKRLAALKDVFDMKSSGVLFFFDEVEAVLRIQSSDPLKDSKRIEAILKRLIKAASVLKISSAEVKKIKKEIEEIEDLNMVVAEDDSAQVEKHMQDEQELKGEDKPQAVNVEEPEKNEDKAQSKE
jgi:hypothetical protein